jgi:hypothetical protein
MIRWNLPVREPAPGYLTRQCNVLQGNPVPGRFERKNRVARASPAGYNHDGN